MPLSWTMDKLGPMCRSAEDCGLVLQVMAGGDNNDPGSAGKSFYYAPQFVRKMAEIRVGYAPVDFEQWAGPAARPAFKQALEVLRGLGLPLKEVELPAMPYGLVAGTIISTEGSSVFEPLIRDGRIDQLADRKQIAGLKAGLEIPARDYLKCMRLRRMIQNEMRRIYADFDVLVSPSRFNAATKISEALDAPPAHKPHTKLRGLRDLGAFGNLAGLPALSLPCGFANELPVALQLCARPWNENLLLAIGSEFQKQTDWHRRRPPA
jgi:aspartyl-tRNA(Asn)/glutamyl-tRNA(Gln) amidotransferase subunit A